MKAPEAGDVYRHYKGNEYSVVCLAVNEADEVPVVVYRDVQAPEKVWVRPLSMFVEEVEVDGAKQARFTYIR